MRVLACAYYTPSFLKINRLIEHSLPLKPKWKIELTFNGKEVNVYNYEKEMILTPQKGDNIIKVSMIAPSGKRYTLTWGGDKLSYKSVAEPKDIISIIKILIDSKDEKKFTELNNKIAELKQLLESKNVVDKEQLKELDRIIESAKKNDIPEFKEPIEELIKLTHELTQKLESVTGNTAAAEKAKAAEIAAREAQQKAEAATKALEEAEAKKKAAEAKEKAAEEAVKNAMEALEKANEANKKDAEASLKKAEAEKKAAEEARLKAEMEKKTAVEARQKAEEEKKTTEEARQKAEEEKKAAEDKAKAAEDKAKAEEEARQKAEDKAKAEVEARQKAEAKAKAEEEARQKAEAKAKAEAEARQKAEEEKKAAEDKAKAAEEALQEIKAEKKTSEEKNKNEAAEKDDKFAEKDLKTLVSITIDGLSNIDHGGKARYACKAKWSDGTVTNVSPEWVLSSTDYATVDIDGKVQNKNNVDQVINVTLNASYTFDNVTKEASKELKLEKQGINPFFIIFWIIIIIGVIAAVVLVVKRIKGIVDSTIRGFVIVSVNGNKVATKGFTYKSQVCGLIKETNKNIEIQYIRKGSTSGADCFKAVCRIENIYYELENTNRKPMIKDAPIVVTGKTIINLYEGDQTGIPFVTLEFKFSK